MNKYLFSALLAALLLTGCQPTASSANTPRILAVESFIADITRQVAGDRVQVDTLIPLGVDPHSFELTPADVSKIAQTDVLIINGAGFESWLNETLTSSDSKAVVINSSNGLNPRKPTALEIQDEDHTEGDPHFWLDPTLAIRYTENIRDGLIKFDPQSIRIF